MLLVFTVLGKPARRIFYLQNKKVNPAHQSMAVFRFQKNLVKNIISNICIYA